MKAKRVFNFIYDDVLDISIAKQKISEELNLSSNFIVFCHGNIADIYLRSGNVGFDLTGDIFCSCNKKVGTLQGSNKNLFIKYTEI